MIRILTPIVLRLALLTPSLANAADAKEGEGFARRVCAMCHAIAPGKTSTEPQAPPFPKIARSSQFRKKGAAFVLEKHPRMPLFALTGEEGENVAAYIRTLRR